MALSADALQCRSADDSNDENRLGRRTHPFFALGADAVHLLLLYRLPAVHALFPFCHYRDGRWLFDLGADASLLCATSGTPQR